MSTNDSDADSSVKSYDPNRRRLYMNIYLSDENDQTSDDSEDETDEEEIKLIKRKLKQSGRNLGNVDKKRKINYNDVSSDHAYSKSSNEIPEVDEKNGRRSGRRLYKNIYVSDESDQTSDDSEDETDEKEIGNGDRNTKGSHSENENLSPNESKKKITAILKEENSDENVDDDEEFVDKNELREQSGLHVKKEGINGDVDKKENIKKEINPLLNRKGRTYEGLPIPFEQVSPLINRGFSLHSCLVREQLLFPIDTPPLIFV